MNAFEAAEKSGWAGDPQNEMKTLFSSPKSPGDDATAIPATSA